MEHWNNPQDNPFKPYKGPTRGAMPRLITDGRTPITPSQLFYRKLEVLNFYLGAIRSGNQEAIAKWEPVMKQWIDYYVDTAFGIAVHPDKKYKMVPNSQFLRELNPQSRLSPSGRALMPDGMFESLEGHQYKQKDIQRYGNKELTQKQALSNPFWGDFIPDQELRALAVINMFEQGKQRVNLVKMMDVYFPSPEQAPVMGRWCFWGLESGSGAVGRDLLGYNSRRIVGVRGEVAEGNAKNLEYILHPK